CSLVCGASAIGDTKTLGKVGIKTMGFYLITTALAITVALSVAKVINPGIGLDISAIEQTKTTIAETASFADTLLDIIPKNPIQGLAEG
ncbi:cation:dicarboxylate symporter family transporter, partial [Terrisporobacter hibernicus]